jgi:hypothetical protein
MKTIIASARLTLLVVGAALFIGPPAAHAAGCADSCAAFKKQRHGDGRIFPGTPTVGDGQDRTAVYSWVYFVDKADEFCTSPDKSKLVCHCVISMQKQVKVNGEWRGAGDEWGDDNLVKDGGASLGLFEDASAQAQAKSYCGATPPPPPPPPVTVSKTPKGPAGLLVPGDTTCPKPAVLEANGTFAGGVFDASKCPKGKFCQMSVTCGDASQFRTVVCCAIDEHSCPDAKQCQAQTLGFTSINSLKTLDDHKKVINTVTPGKQSAQ